MLCSDYYRCARCANPLPTVVPRDGCFRCRDSGWKFSRVLTLGPYRGRLREAVILSKKRSYETLRIGLAQLLVERLHAEDQLQPSSSLAPLLVPVPNHWTHSFSRAAPTASSLAFAIGRLTQISVTTNLVRRTRKTAKQGMLSWTERKQNVRGAFEINRAKILSGRHVWLIDDVLTSGATAAELSRCLLQAGAEDVSVMVIARGTGAKDRSRTD